MVRVSVELVRKRAEHHDRQLAPLQEISLHQEGIEKIEYMQDWCPKLQILLLQSNLIKKIENLNKLKELQYLNLAINNIEKIENLERCESLQKLDLTLNFIGELTSITSLKDNYNLQHLYLNGNPCTDFTRYREYVIAILPQLEDLDNEEIKRSERILALQNLPQTEKEIKKQQIEYFHKREEQKCRLEKEISEKWRAGDMDLEDEEKCKRFWNEKSEHAPEVRIEMDRQTRLRQQNKQEKILPKKARRLFTDDGRPFNINEAKIPFRLNDEKDGEYNLELQIYKYLDTSYIDIDVQPIYVRVTIKGKIFQICLPEEINVCESEAQRSQTTGYLTIVMPKHNKTLKTITSSNDTKPQNIKCTNEGKKNVPERNSKRELLEIGPSRNPFDFSNADNNIIPQTSKQTPDKSIFVVKVKEPPRDFVDNPEVPPLI